MTINKSNVVDYYEKIAGSYDKSRFNNSYGFFIDKQERDFLNTLHLDFYTTLDAGCGTGRFLNFAYNGIDISPEMLKISKAKHPQSNITLGSLNNIPFSDGVLETVFSFHVIMHLNRQQTEAFVKESHRVLKTGGTLIFDFPSKKRRQLTAYKSENWHGANELSISDITSFTSEEWELKTIRGILFFPIHRLPEKIRPFFLKIDSLLCQSFLKEYASYLIVILEKK